MKYRAIFILSIVLFFYSSVSASAHRPHRRWNSDPLIFYQETVTIRVGAFNTGAYGAIIRHDLDCIPVVVVNPASILFEVWVAEVDEETFHVVAKNRGVPPRALNVTATFWCVDTGAIQ